jgi:hypothetical protein
MKVIQLSVFLENRAGRLYELCELLGRNKLNIRALTIAESPEFGIVRLVVDKSDEAAALLKKSGFVANVADIVAVEVSDQPGGLAGVLKVLNEAGQNIEYMYGFVERSSEKALLVFRFDDPDGAIAILQKNGIGVVGSKDIESL